MPTPRRGLAFQITLVTLTVAVVAVGLAGLVGVRLANDATRSAAGVSLAAQADIVRDLVTERPARPGGEPPAARLGGLAGAVALLRRQGIEVLRLNPRGQVIAVGEVSASAAPDVLQPGDQDVIATRGRLSATRTVDGRRVLLEARALPQGFIALVQPVGEFQGLARSDARRLLIALLIGLAVAGIAGALLAQRLARPLQRSAHGALLLAGGARGHRVEVAGPAEVANVAEALNSLATALERSEGRQRDFLVSVSHELRTPLTAVRGFAEALTDGVTPPGEVAPTGAVILAEAQRLERLVSDLLDLARLGAQDFRIDPAPVDLRAVAAAAAEVWSARCAAEGVPFRADLPTDPVPVTTDSGRVRQIIDGLAENALRVTPAGSPIVLSLDRVGWGVVLQVRDGGPGLTPDDCAVAFERSALYDRYRGVRRVGTGVGLALVAGLAGRLGGRASAGRAPEGGACFTIELPDVPPQPNVLRTGAAR